MKIISVSHSDSNGGAARAAYRIHQALLGRSMDTTMSVAHAVTGNSTVESQQRNIVAKILTMGGRAAVRFLKKTLGTGNPILHSPAVIPSSWSKRFDNLHADIIHLHWVNHEMISIADIGRIKKPLVWTLHDMWAFCGAEHVTGDYRWRDGYMANNRPGYETGFDLNRWTASRKLKHWTRPIYIVTPSRWLADCAKQSVLMRDWPITVIPNAIDTDVWKPVNKALARHLLGLPPDVPLLMFGAWGGTNEPHKGFDLLQTALNHLQGQLPDLELVVFGQLAPKTPVAMKFPVHYTGHLHDDVSLRLLYSACDAIVIPSRQDNLPNMGLEAHACGTPVIAFDTCGLPDIVAHQQTGYLAKAFDPLDLAAGIQWVLPDANRLAAIGQAARERSVKLWGYNVVADQYVQVYQTAIDAVRT